MVAQVSTRVPSRGRPAYRPASAPNRPRRVLSPDQLGTTYTEDVARNAGLSDAQAFALMHKMGISVLRLGAYWDQIQPSGPSDANFAELDRQLALARQYGMKVILTVGIKSPGWPEAHIPKWAAPSNLKESGPGTDLAQSEALKQHALAYDTLLIQHVSGDSNIVAFQVENEPGVPFGPVNDYVGAPFVQQEARLIKQLDPHKRPLALNVGIPISAESQQLIAMPEFDLVGLDVYPEPGCNQLGKPRPVTLLERSRTVDDPRKIKALVESYGKQAYVAEMQAEPWNPVEWNATKTMENFDAQRRNGFDVIFPWNVRFVFSTLAKGDKSEFDAWKRMASDLRHDTPPPPDPRGSLWDRLVDEVKGVVEFFRGKDNGQLLGY